MSYKSQSRLCSLPEVPQRSFDPGLDPDRLSLLRTIDNKWVNGTNLRYAFFDNHPAWRGSDAFKQVVQDAFEVWKDVGIGLEFTRVQHLEEAEIRIGFAQDGRSWSRLGRDILNAALNERTMNLGWDITVAGPNGLDTAVHELGHTLGFPHEHQNPNAGIEWDAPAVYQEFGAPPNNWSHDMVDWNILRKLSRQEFEGSSWDVDSIMHYSFPAGLVLKPEKYQHEPLTPSPGLSSLDKEEVRRYYPPLSSEDHQKLEPFQLEKVEVAPGEQLNYFVEPTETGTYHFRTFGSSDTVMVLFEGRDDPRFVAGADDTGTDLNASLDVRLERGKHYILRLRLYWRNLAGQTALFMWK